ncbi:hypothetical protein BSLG_008151 [Batrachochytrium salamandrivorans]|nr:hypothetical protein BASA62_008209 [Batrachochytrium salamandrivorans]KAJ1334316.1 hypothetical protein BSLG_008151 [Batrachochytrium salamandrivorans]
MVRRSARTAETLEGAEKSTVVEPEVSELPPTATPSKRSSTRVQRSAKKTNTATPSKRTPARRKAAVQAAESDADATEETPKDTVVGSPKATVEETSKDAVAESVNDPVQADSDRSTDITADNEVIADNQVIADTIASTQSGVEADDTRVMSLETDDTQLDTKPEETETEPAPSDTVIMEDVELAVLSEEIPTTDTDLTASVSDVPHDKLANAQESVFSDTRDDVSIVADADDPMQEDTAMADATSTKAAPLHSSADKDVSGKRRASNEQMEANPEAKKRSKRMFQVLVDTLQTAKKDQTTNLSEAALRRQTIEQRLAEKLVKERAELTARIQKDRATAVAKRQATESEVKDVAAELVQAQKKVLLNHLCTKASPGIYFIPANHNTLTLKALKASVGDGGDSKGSELNSTSA